MAKILTSLPPKKIILPSLFYYRRGKKLQKHFTVFLAEVTPGVRASWIPELNEEHTAYDWIPIHEACARNDLHPVVKRVLLEEPHKSQVLAAISPKLPPPSS